MKTKAKKTSKNETTDDVYVVIDPEIKEKEHKRCSEWNGNESGCKENKCWYYRRSKKCKAHMGILSGKPPKPKASSNSFRKSSMYKKRSNGKRRSSKRNKKYVIYKYR